MVARPIPQAAPVTIAVLPASSGSSAFRDGVEPRADLVRVAAELLEPRQLGQAAEPEDALEERRRAIADGAARSGLAARLCREGPARPGRRRRSRRRRRGYARSPAACTGRGTPRSPASRARPAIGLAPPACRRGASMLRPRRARRGRRIRRRPARARSRFAPPGSARRAATAPSRCVRARPRSPPRARRSTAAATRRPAAPRSCGRDGRPGWSRSGGAERR